jgi:hypothetical protein
VIRIPRSWGTFFGANIDTDWRVGSAITYRGERQAKRFEDKGAIVAFEPNERLQFTGIIELHRRIARGFRNLTNYRLRMVLAAGRLTHPNLRSALYR